MELLLDSPSFIFELTFKKISSLLFWERNSHTPRIRRLGSPPNSTVHLKTDHEHITFRLFASVSSHVKLGRCSKGYLRFLSVITNGKSYTSLNVRTIISVNFMRFVHFQCLIVGRRTRLGVRHLCLYCQLTGLRIRVVWFEQQKDHLRVSH